MTALRVARRQVVLLAFPFSDLSAQKLRPALVLADAAAPTGAALLHHCGQRMAGGLVAFDRDEVMWGMNEELVA